MPPGSRKGKGKRTKKLREYRLEGTIAAKASRGEGRKNCKAEERSLEDGTRGRVSYAEGDWRRARRGENEITERKAGSR